MHTVCLKGTAPAAVVGQVTGWGLSGAKPGAVAGLEGQLVNYCTGSHVRRSASPRRSRFHLGSTEGT